MRPGAPAGAAGDAEALARLEALARGDERPRQVRVQRGEPVAETEQDDVTVPLVAGDVPRAKDSTRRRRADGRRAQDPDVETRVPAIAVPAEGRRDRPLGRPRERQLPPRVRVRGGDRRQGEGHDNAADQSPHWGGRLAEHQKISGHQGWRSQRNKASARANAPGFSSSTRPARASSANETPPRYTEPSDCTGSLRSGAPSVRSADVNDANPEAVAQAEPHPTRRRQEQEQRVPQRQDPEVDRRLPVDREQVRPEIPERLRRRPRAPR